MCGEKIRNDVLVLAEAGSPPRVRGEERRTIVRRRKGGITPACAGRRCPAVIDQREAEDHPRVCGEKFGTPLTVSSVLGSPPRVRGEEGKGKDKWKRDRITPACAGRSYFDSEAQRAV